MRSGTGARAAPYERTPSVLVTSRPESDGANRVGEAVDGIECRRDGEEERAPPVKVGSAGI